MKIVIWYELGFKSTIRELGYSDQTLHLACGMMIVLLGIIVPRRPLPLIGCVGLALGLASGNELMDALFFGNARWADTLTDMSYTIALPLLVLGGLMMWGWIRPSVRPTPRDQVLRPSDAASE